MQKMQKRDYMYSLPFEKLRSSRKFSTAFGMNEKAVFHLHPNRNFLNCGSNGKQLLYHEEPKAFVKNRGLL